MTLFFCLFKRIVRLVNIKLQPAVSYCLYYLNCNLPWLPYSLLLPPCWEGSDGYGDGPGPSWAIISITLGMIIWLGLIVLNLLASGPSGSSLMCISDLMATGRQLHVGSMVTSSNSELVKYRWNQTVKIQANSGKYIFMHYTFWYGY